MSFIHSVLFGFPTKIQSDLRYEPKRHAKYGGQLFVTLPQGKAVIERVKGKATGDVKVTLEDGTTGGEDLLHKLLSKIDKSLYQSIYSFNLHGLQNVQQMKNEDLGKFLFSTGALGTERLLATENTLQKELESRYKPNGKKPILNEKIAALKALHQELKKAEQHNDQYWKYIEEKERLEQAIQAHNFELINKQNAQSRLKEWKRYLPLMNEENALKAEWAELEHTRFPDEGMNKLEYLKRKQDLCAQKMSKVANKIQELKTEIENTKPNEELLENELEINTAVENLPLYEQLKQEHKQLELQLTEWYQEIAELQQRLHLQMNEEQVLKSNTSFFMKEKTASAQSVATRLKEKKQELDAQFHLTKNELEELEVQLQNTEQSLLSQTELEGLQTQIKLTEGRSQQERELSELRDHLLRLKGLASDEAKQHTQNVVGMIVFSLVFLILASWSMIEQQWLILAVSGAGLLYVLLFQSRKHLINRNRYRNELAELTEKEKRLAHELSHMNGQSSGAIVQKLELDQEKREQERILRIKWEQRNEQYEIILDAYEQWEMEQRAHQVMLEGLGRELGVPTDISQSYIHDAFLLIEKLKSTWMQINKWRKRNELVKSEIVQIENRMNNLANKYLDSESNQLLNVAYLLKKILKNEQKKQILYHEKCLKLDELEVEWKQVNDEKDELLMELKQLLDMAGVQTEFEFQSIGELVVRKNEVRDRLKDIENQLSVSGLGLNDKQEFSDIDVEKQITQLLLEQKLIQEELNSTQERLAEVKYQIAVLEDGGTYADLLHQYKLNQSELNIEAKNWAKFAVAKDLLNQAVGKYKNERLPKMIEKAESFLRELTDDHYIRIHTQKVGSSFLIESSDHILYEPRELSQATSEQIYVSLRLALATTLYEKYKFPIIIDDSFVNFDHIRTSKVIGLLSQLKGHQILFFTCHQHLLPYFKNAKLVKMGEYDTSTI